VSIYEKEILEATPHGCGDPARKEQRKMAWTDLILEKRFLLPTKCQYSTEKRTEVLYRCWQNFPEATKSPACTCHHRAGVMGTN
jgi:hypothetical protein